MTDKNLKELLNNLHDVLENTEKVDPDTLELVRNLDKEINRLVDPDSPEDDFDGVVDQAKAVETRFAVDHPIAERFLREIIETLVFI